MYLHHARRDGSRVFKAAAEPQRTEKGGSGGTAAYGEEKIFTKYKDYERVIEIMESRLRGGRFFD